MNDEFGPVHAASIGGDAPGTPVRLEDMTALVAQTVPNFWDDWFRESGNAPIRFRKRLEVADLTLAVSAARSGLGVTIAPSASIESDVANGTLFAPLGFARRPTGYRLCCRAADRDLKPIAALRAWLVAEGCKPLSRQENLPPAAD